MEREGTNWKMSLDIGFANRKRKKVSILFSTIFLIFFTTIVYGQTDPFGVWMAVDDSDGQPTSHIEVFEKNGKMYGKIVKLIEESEDVLCTECKGSKKNQPILGMEILWDMKKNGLRWNGGKIMDPENGKTYRCKVVQTAPDVLEVRGFIGVSLLGRTQRWTKLD